MDLFINVIALTIVSSGKIRTSFAARLSCVVSVAVTCTQRAAPRGHVAVLAAGRRDVTVIVAGSTAGLLLSVAAGWRQRGTPGRVVTVLATCARGWFQKLCTHCDVKAVVT